LDWIDTNQFGRRNLSSYARVELALKLEPLLKAKSKAKQVDGGKHKVPQKSAEAVETRNELAKAAGVSQDAPGRLDLEPPKDAPECHWRTPWPAFRHFPTRHLRLRRFCDALTVEHFLHFPTQLMA